MPSLRKRRKTFILCVTKSAVVAAVDYKNEISYKLRLLVIYFPKRREECNTENLNVNSLVTNFSDLPEIIFFA